MDEYLYFLKILIEFCNEKSKQPTIFTSYLHNDTCHYFL